MPHHECLTAGDPVITYIAGNLEPNLGFRQFMRALPSIQKDHKTAHTDVAGGDEVSYGRKPEGAKSWREKMLQEVGSQLDPARTHFLGKVPYATYKRVLQVSAAHVYLTYPFVLSWSMLEAMATGCLVIGSDTAPVREVLEPRRTGWLTPFGDAEKLSEHLSGGLESTPTQGGATRLHARQSVSKAYSTERGLSAFEGICLAADLQIPQSRPAMRFK